MQNLAVLESTSPSAMPGKPGNSSPTPGAKQACRDPVNNGRTAGRSEDSPGQAGCVWWHHLHAYLAAQFPGLHPCTFPLLSCHSAPRSTEQAVENAILATPLFLVNPLEAPTATTFSLTSHRLALSKPCHSPFPGLHLRARHHELPSVLGWARPGLRLPTPSAPLSLLSDMDIVLVSALLTFPLRSLPWLPKSG